MQNRLLSGNRDFPVSAAFPTGTALAHAGAHPCLRGLDRLEINEGALPKIPFPVFFQQSVRHARGHVSNILDEPTLVARIPITVE
jgi:hypothetical protein